MVPLSLRGKYQLVALGTDVASQVQELAAAVRLAMRDLGVNGAKFLRLLVADEEHDPKQSTVAVLFALSGPPSAEDEARLLALEARGHLVLPVVSDKAKFAELVPSALAHLNGASLAECGADMERLAGYVMEGYGLLRHRRRLFISYRRAEASGVAAQLYEELDAAGFDVFLDTHGSIRPGEPFQDVLWHRLSDTEVALVLDTPGFLVSRWTEEELAKANSACIQMLQVTWPGQEELAPSALSTFLLLEDGSFEPGGNIGPAARLTSVQLSAIVDAVEGLRARALAARHNFLVAEFVREARDAGLHAYQTPDRALVVRRREAAGNEVLILPTVGVPDAEQYQLAAGFHARQWEDGRAYLPPAILLYDDSGLMRRWREHLSWLDTNLSTARGLALTDAAGCLRRSFGPPA